MYNLKIYLLYEKFLQLIVTIFNFPLQFIYIIWLLPFVALKSDYGNNVQKKVKLYKFKYIYATVEDITH
jgi:uncharacterized membrane protein